MTTRTAMLGTLWRGLLSRRILSLGSLLLLSLALGSALLGPSFQDAVTRSFVVTRLNDAPNQQTGISWLYQGHADSPARQADEALAAVGGITRGPFAAGQVTWESVRADVPGPGALGPYGGRAMMLAKDGVCDQLTLVSGRCPRRPDEAMLLDADREVTGLAVGDTAALGQLGDVEVVGTYRAPVGENDYWFDPGRLGSQPRYVNETTGLVTPYEPGPFIVPVERFARLAAEQYEVRVDRRLDLPPDFEQSQVDEAVAASVLATKGDRIPVERGSLRPDSLNDLVATAATFEEQKATARASIAPAVLSLVLVALALLLRLLTSAAELRVPELSLASLRGMSRRQMWMLGLAEPLGLLLLSVPVGLLVGGTMATGLVRSWLVPGLSVPVPAGSLVAGLLVLLSAAAVSVVAVGSVLRDSLAAQLGGVRRPHRTRRAVVVLELALVALALAILATKLAGGGAPARPDATDLVLPVLLGVVAGLVATRAAAWLAAWWTRRRTSSLSLFVSVRALARRQEGTLVILPITVAVAVGIFALGVSDAAANWRASVAATAAPADEVWSSPHGVRLTHELTQRIDPEGQYLMSASEFSAFGGLFAVLDTPRLARVADWDPSWTGGLTGAEVADLVGPAAEQPVLRGRRVTARTQVQRRAPQRQQEDLYLELRLEASDGPGRVYLGPLPDGTAEVSARLSGCRAGCALAGVSIGRRAGLPAVLDDRVAVTALAVDGREVEGALDAAWVLAPDTPVQEQVGSVAFDADGVRFDLDSRGRPEVARFSTSGVRRYRPVLVGVDAVDNLRRAPDGGFEVQVSADSLPVDPVRQTESVPFFGPEGLLIDQTMLASDRQLFDPMFVNHVLARSDTPAAMRQQLADQGLTVETTRAAQERNLGQGAYALALRLYLVVAVLVLLMALAGLVVSMAVQLPSRRRDAAALRVVGVSRRSVMGAVGGELVGVLGTAVLAGIVAGTLAQDVILRTVTLGYVESMATPHLVTRVDTGGLAFTVAVAVLLLGIAGWLSAWLTVRGARGATLRENAR